MNNNIIPACIIGSGLFYVGANMNKEQETKVIQAEPVVAKTVASSTGVGEPVIVWYDAIPMPHTATGNNTALVDSKTFCFGSCLVRRND